jgi:hypothetical protein
MTLKLITIKPMESKNILVTVSGGRSSAMMAYHIHTNEKYKDFNKAYVFCNTGMERPETIDFLKKIESEWSIDLNLIEGVYSSKLGVGVGYKIVSWDTLDMNANPFSESIMHINKGSYDGLPNQEAPYCSDRMKVQPSKKFADDIFGKKKYITAVGFRKEDMPKRISWAEIKADDKRIFPLLTDFSEPIGLLELNKFWESQSFKLEINSKLGNCELCWKKSDKVLVDNIRYGTRFVDWFKQMEDKYGSTSFRGNRSIMDFVKMSEQPFTPEINFGQEDYNCVCNF